MFLKEWQQLSPAFAFAACRQAVNDQLAQQPTQHSPTNGNGHTDGTPSRNGHSHANGNGQGARQDVASATQSQVRESESQMKHDDRNNSESP